MIGYADLRECRDKHLHVKECPLELTSPKPLAVMSNRALSCEMVVACVSHFPVMGCRCGSIETLWHTSDRSLPVRSQISLCLEIGKPPFGHDKAWSTENGLLQQQLAGRFCGCHPYCSAMASRNAPL